LLPSTSIFAAKEVTQTESPTRKADMHRVACTGLVLEKNESYSSDYQFSYLRDFTLGEVCVKKYCVGDEIDLNV
jgi:hypothetical protein